MDLFAQHYSLLALFFAAVAGFVLGRMGRPDPRRAAERERQEKAETARLDRAYGTLAQEKRHEIERLLKDGKIIEAIRDIRLALGCGLKEAKDLSERVRDRL